ncbi:tRNA (guanine(6)-N2)-methyltransferase THUMP3-like [Prorops nasuta]|uniref:tRNA (guanine(6)-N2)-methyltransferase THUMP3-like n=1 Tax=Prorops nasuta TaxID=863751 RepID=UPI0034CD78EE
MSRTVNGSDLLDFFRISLKCEANILVAASVDTGFEWQAIDECTEKLGKNLEIVKTRGRIYFIITYDLFYKVCELRSIDNIFIIANIYHLDFEANKQSDLELILKNVRNDVLINKSLFIWKRITGFPGKIHPSREEYEVAHETKLLENLTIEPTGEKKKGRIRGTIPHEASETCVLKFRVTCERTGEHSFDSNDAARIVGGELQNKYLWVADMTKYHLEIVCKIIQDKFIINFRVTPISMHHRNIVAFGPTTLRATICYNLLRLVKPVKGDIVIDPMCGGGSIPIEGAAAYPYKYVLCGDYHDLAVQRAKTNINAMPDKKKIDLLQLNVNELPFRDSCIDIIVADMPFGKRSGHKVDNRILYKNFLQEAARVIRQSTGRLSLLTHDRRSFNQAIKTVKYYFHIKNILAVTIGGLSAAVYVLIRTDYPFQSNKLN